MFFYGLVGLCSGAFAALVRLGYGLNLIERRCVFMGLSIVFPMAHRCVCHDLILGNKHLRVSRSGWGLGFGRSLSSYAAWAIRVHDAVL